MKEIIDNFTQMVAQAKKVKQVNNRVYSRNPERDGKSDTLPYIVIAQVGGSAGTTDDTGEIDKVLAYSVDIYADNERIARNIASSLASLYMEVGISLSSQLSGGAVPSAFGHRVAQTYAFRLDRNGLASRT